jgi:hypothetical protein
MANDPDDPMEEHRRQMAAVTLRTGSYGSVWSRLSAYISTDGSLVISGHDLGQGASLIGDELETWVKVEKRHLKRLADLLATRLGSDERTTTAIPSTLRLAFERGEFETSGQVTDWMKEHGVPSSFSSWP